MPGVEFIQLYGHFTTVDCWPMPYLKCSGRMLFSIFFSGILFQWILPNCSSWFSFTFIWQLMPGVEFIQWHGHITTVDCWPMQYLKCSGRMLFSILFFGNSLSMHSTQSWFSFTFLWQLMPGVEFIQWDAHYYSRLLAHAVPEMFIAECSSPYFFSGILFQCILPNPDLVLHFFDSLCRVWSSSSDMLYTLLQ